jgi:hypothetical protein
VASGPTVHDAGDCFDRGDIAERTSATATLRVRRPREFAAGLEDRIRLAGAARVPMARGGVRAAAEPERWAGTSSCDGAWGVLRVLAAIAGGDVLSLILTLRGSVRLWLGAAGDRGIPRGRSSLPSPAAVAVRKSAADGDRKLGRAGDLIPRMRCG